MRFIYRRYPFIPMWLYTAWQDVNEDEEKQIHCADLSYISNCAYQCQVRNSDGYGFGKLYTFWLPTPTKPKEGAPWLMQVMQGSFTDTHYDLSCQTDIACHLHVLVGTDKPWISPTTHVIHGVVFHHDAELYFHWYLSVDQNEEGDVTDHTFHIPAPLDNVTYWIVAMGTVDDLESPSISPPYSFLRVPVPTMQVDDATDITTDSAIIHGRIFDDKGQPVYARMRYTKIDPYTHYTPIIGPFPSVHNWPETISGLDSDTEYKFSSIGSHDLVMERYGWSPPKYFRTLPGVYYLMCHTPEIMTYSLTLYSNFAYSWAFKATSSYDLAKFSIRIARIVGINPPPVFNWRLYNSDINCAPIGAPLVDQQSPPPTSYVPTYEKIEFTFTPVPIVSGQYYAAVLHIDSYAGWPHVYKLAVPLHPNNTCPPETRPVHQNYPYSTGWVRQGLGLGFYYQTWRQ